MQALSKSIYKTLSKKAVEMILERCGKTLLESLLQELLEKVLANVLTASSPLTTHHPPPTPVPEAIHPPAGARVRPTLDQARDIAPEIGITPDQAEAWWLAREASQWLRSSNGALMPVGDNWRADAKTFTQNALQRRHPHATHRPTPVRSDSANAPGRYA